MKKAKSIAQGFKEETLKKFLQLAQITIKFYIMLLQHGAQLTVCVSNGNRKIGYIPNVSLMPILTCPNCKHCKSLCYDIKACLQYVNVLNARARNTAILQFSPQMYWNQINAFLDRTTKKHFRFHVGGEIQDYSYFCSMIETVKKHPNITFWTYTKSYPIVNRYIAENGALPANLSVMFSVWKLKTEDGKIVTIPIPNPYNLPTFTVRFEEEQAPKNVMKCHGHCKECIANHCGCVAKQSVYADAH